MRLRDNQVFAAHRNTYAHPNHHSNSDADSHSHTDTARNSNANNNPFTEAYSDTQDSPNAATSPDRTALIRGLRRDHSARVGRVNPVALNKQTL
jgi:hypothetical protein